MCAARRHHRFLYRHTFGGESICMVILKHITASQAFHSTAIQLYPPYEHTLLLQLFFFFLNFIGGFCNISRLLCLIFWYEKKLKVEEEPLKSEEETEY